jgi:uncharacterized protein with FMN-binding domain
MKKKRKVFLIVLGILAAVTAGFVLFLSVGLGLKDAPVKAVDVTKVPDGTYAGELTGSRFANRLEVTVSGGRITAIRILSDMMVVIPGVSSQIFAAVMEDQSLQADSVSGATATSKAYLKSLENALDRVALEEGKPL